MTNHHINETVTKSQPREAAFGELGDDVTIDDVTAALETGGIAADRIYYLVGQDGAKALRAARGFWSMLDEVINRPLSALDAAPRGGAEDVSPQLHRGACRIRCGLFAKCGANSAEDAALPGSDDALPDPDSTSTWRMGPGGLGASRPTSLGYEEPGLPRSRWDRSALADSP